MASVLMTGKGTAGSWLIRGQQLGEAIGAEIQPMAEPHDCRQADLVVVVKRTPGTIIQAIRATGRRWVWDIVDAWPQPVGNNWSRDQAIGWLRTELRRLQPDAVVFPTRRMQEDACFTGPSITVPHHAWGKYKPAPLRERVRIVGYEGAAHYLGRWERIVREECERRGWEFRVNGDMQDADIGIALRDADGYPARHWKSNCKQANLQALGIPCLLSRESGYVECASGAEFWIDTAEDIARAFDAVAPLEARQEIRRQQLRAAPRIETIAKEYRTWLDSL